MADRKRPQLNRSKVVEDLPAACANETAAVEFFERQLWGDTPYCPCCASVDVYPMKDRKTGERNRRFLWRCRDCNKHFTVRTGSIFAESLVPMHKWARAIWEATSCKNGVSALELSRKIQVTHKTALFMLNRLRHAMAPDIEPEPKLSNTVEMDETYCGGKPRKRQTRAQVKKSKRIGRGTKKTPVLAVIERGGSVRTRVVANVTAKNIGTMLAENVEPGSTIMTDDFKVYRRVAREHGTHKTVMHSIGQYVSYRDRNVHTNSIEGYFARVKRSLNGVYHAVSPEHLHRYVEQCAYAHNTRKLNDGERITDLITRTRGRRLMYREPATKAG